MSEELRKCPFCKHDALIVADIYYRHGTEIYNGACNVCGAESKACDSKEEAIKAWNTRPSEDALKAEVEELRYIVKKFEQWCGDDDTGCPKSQYPDYPCVGEKEFKEKFGGDADFDNIECDEGGEGCWVAYYRWKYKQEKEKGCKEA